MAYLNPPPRKRSPRFPSHPLRDALVYAKKIYEAVHRTPIDSNTAVQIMGFAGKSGASASALGSVRQYGLIEGVGESTRVSELGLRLLEPSSEAEYYRTLRVAAFEPRAFQAISERFSGKIPSVDEPIRSYLIRDLDFSQPGATECIQSLRATLELLAQNADDSASDSPNSSISNDTRADTQPAETERSAASLQALHFVDSSSVTQARFPLTRDCYAELTVYGEIGAKALENLKRQVEFLSEVWGES